MMSHFVLRNLFHRPVRTAIGVLAIGFEVMLVIVIVGLTSGMLQETAKRIEGIGADVNIEFVDRAGTGDYRMTRDPNENRADTNPH